MNGNIHPSSSLKIAFQTSNSVITRLVADNINTNNDNQITLLYVGTQDGQVLKLVQRKKGEKFILLTSWILEENDNEKSPVRNMVLAQVNNQLILIIYISIFDFN